MNYVHRDDYSTHDRTKKDEHCYISQLTDGLFTSQEKLVSSSCSVFGKKFLPVVSSNSLPRTNLHSKSSASTSTTECKRTRKSKQFDFELKRPSATESRGPATSMPKRKTWQELSAEINQFAEQNIRNAGWDLRTSKQKSRSEADLFYLTSQTTQVIRRAEKVLQDSLESQQKLQAWDKKVCVRFCLYFPLCCVNTNSVESSTVSLTFRWASNDAIVER
jgi:hypothetical protein